MTFAVGDKVRYKPGFGTYGYEGVVDADGRVAGVIVGFSRTRVRVETLNDRGPVTRAVDAASLRADDGSVEIAKENGVRPPSGDRAFTLSRVTRQVVDAAGFAYALPVLVTEIDANGKEYRIAGKAVPDGTYLFYLTVKRIDGVIRGLGKFLALEDAKANAALVYQA